MTQPFMALVHRVGDGQGDVHDDEQQMRVFYEREYPRVFGAVAMYVGSVALAEDIAQEALTKALSRWSRIRDVDRPGAYVHRIAINLANAHFRRRRIAHRVQARLGPSEDVHRDSDAADAVAVRGAVAELPRRQRQVVVLRYQGDLPLADVADVLGISIGTVKSHLHDAMNRLREQLQAEEAADAH